MKKYLVELSKESLNWIAVEAENKESAKLVALEKAEFLLWNEGEIMVEGVKQIKNESTLTCEKTKDQ